jgi:hypothetical protein
MSVTLRPAILRPTAVVILAVIIAGCATTTSPSAGTSAAASPPGAPTPFVTDHPTGSPPSLADAVVDLPSAEGGLNAIWSGDGTIVAGGFAGPDFTSTILAFDGTSWSVAEVPDEPGQVTGIARIGNRIIAVGNGLPDIRHGFIWESEDGRIWHTLRTIEDAALYDVIAGEGVIVAAGADLDAEMNATAMAWFSTDGANWEQAEVASAVGTSIGSVTATVEGFAATGDRRLGEARPFWQAKAASSWTAVQNDLGDQLLPSDIVAWGDRLALAGASGKSGDQHPFVALSPDGQRWERTILSEAEGYASAAVVVNDRLVVAGIDGDRLTLWSLRDGAWDADTYEQSGASISALTWVADVGLVAVGARDGRHATWVFEGD